MPHRLSIQASWFPSLAQASMCEGGGMKMSKVCYDGIMNLHDSAAVEWRA